ncbi:hypothetical protein JOM56_007045 [Amanita muscaria]
MPEQAIELVEVMISTSSTGSGPSSAMGVPHPASSTFTTISARFFDSEEVEMALVWLMDQQQHDPGGDPPAPGQLSEASGMIESLASYGMVDKLNDVSKRMLMDGAKESIAPTVTQKIITFAADMKRMQAFAISNAEQKLKFLNVKHEPAFADEYMPYILHSYGPAPRARAVPADMKPAKWTDLPNVAIQVEIDCRQKVFPPGSHSSLAADAPATTKTSLTLVVNRRTVVGL